MPSLVFSGSFQLRRRPFGSSSGLAHCVIAALGVICAVLEEEKRRFPRQVPGPRTAMLLAATMPLSISPTFFSDLSAITSRLAHPLSLSRAAAPQNSDNTGRLCPPHRDVGEYSFGIGGRERPEGDENMEDKPSKKSKACSL